MQHDLLLYLTVAIAVIYPAYKWYVAIPPMPIAPDDPLLLKAQAKAIDHFDIFIELLSIPTNQGLIKCRFLCDSGEYELLWADILSPTEELAPGQPIDILLQNYPVTQQSPLDQQQTISFDDIIDWQIFTEKGQVYGAFTQRAMYDIATRDNIKLSHSIKKARKDYQAPALPPKQEP